MATKEEHPRGYVYVVEFSDGWVKVGMSLSPDKRLASHKTDAKKFGVAVVRHWVSGAVHRPREVEAAALTWCSSRAVDVRGRETFCGLVFDDVVRHVRQIPPKSPKHYTSLSGPEWIGTVRESVAGLPKSPPSVSWWYAGLIPAVANLLTVPWGVAASLLEDDSDAEFFAHVVVQGAGVPQDGETPHLAGAVRGVATVVARRRGISLEPTAEAVEQAEDWCLWTWWLQFHELLSRFMDGSRPSGRFVMAGYSDECRIVQTLFGDIAPGDPVRSFWDVEG